MSRSCLLRMLTCGYWCHMHAVSHACGANATVPGRQPKPAERLLRVPWRARRKTMTKTQLVAGHVGSEDSLSACFFLLCEYVSRNVVLWSLAVQAKARACQRGDSDPFPLRPDTRPSCSTPFVYIYTTLLSHGRHTPATAGDVVTPIPHDREATSIVIGCSGGAGSRCCPMRLVRARPCGGWRFHERTSIASSTKQAIKEHHRQRTPAPHSVYHDVAHCQDDQVHNPL